MYDTNRMWALATTHLNSYETSDEKIYTILNRNYSDEVLERISLPMHAREFEWHSLEFLELLKVMHD